jgi:hypothetical protein
MQDSFVGETSATSKLCIAFSYLNQHYVHILGSIAKGAGIQTLLPMSSCVLPSCGLRDIYPIFSHQKWVLHVTCLLVYVGVGHRNMTMLTRGQILTRIGLVVS